MKSRFQWPNVGSFMLTPNPKSEYFLAAFALEASSVDMWLKSYVSSPQESVRMKVRSEKLFELFCDWCKETKMNGMSSPMFYSQLDKVTADVGMRVEHGNKENFRILDFDQLKTKLNLS